MLPKGAFPNGDWNHNVKPERSADEVKAVE
jgi:hypothetical protein